MIIENMAAQGKEPTFCMGDDVPLAVLSQKPHMLYDYFKQRFAQVGMSILKILCEKLCRGTCEGLLSYDAFAVSLVAI